MEGQRTLLGRRFKAKFVQPVRLASFPVCLRMPNDAEIVHSHLSILITDLI